MMDEVPMVAKVAMISFVLFSVAPMRFWEWLVRPIDRIQEWMR